MSADWRWRERIRANVHTRRVYRAAVAVAGLLVVLAGLALVPLPGPGWVVVFVGVAIWASEFAWAARLRDGLRQRLVGWNRWVAARSVWVKTSLGLGTAAAVGAACYGALALSEAW